MKRRKYSDSEQDDLQRLKRENDKLKRQISALRKQLARIDINRYENLQDLIHKYDKQEAEEILAKEQKSNEEKWKCYHCQDGVLRLKIYQRLDGIFYNRKCDQCPNKTKLKKWNDDIEGVE